MHEPLANHRKLPKSAFPERKKQRGIVLGDLLGAVHRKSVACLPEAHQKVGFAPGGSTFKRAQRRLKAHLDITTRTIGPQGFGGKEREWNRKELLSGWREAWARDTNQALERADRFARIDHRSLAAQHQEAIRNGDQRLADTLDREPEPHYGKGAWMAARTGQANERTDRGLAVQEINKGYQSERENGREWIEQIRYEIQRLTYRAVERGRDLGRSFGFER